jgi:hypothetical protein
MTATNATKKQRTANSELAKMAANVRVETLVQ